MAGYLLAHWLPGYVVRHAVDEPASLRLAPDSTVLAYAIGIVFLTTLLFGLAPALRSTRISVSDAMKQQSANLSPRMALRDVLVGVQVAISVILLAGAGLLIRGLAEVQRRDPGFRVDGVMQVAVDLPASRYSESSSRSYFQRLRERLSASRAVPTALCAVIQSILALPRSTSALVTSIFERVPA